MRKKGRGYPKSPPFVFVFPIRTFVILNEAKCPNRKCKKKKNFTFPFNSFIPLRNVGEVDGWLPSCVVEGFVFGLLCTLMAVMANHKNR